MRVNKFPALLIFLLFLSGPGLNKVFAQGQLLEQKISIQANAVSIEKALTMITNATGNISFSYGEDVIRDSHTVSFQLRNKTVREALDVIFEGKINYKERGRHIILQKITTKEVSKENEYFLISGYVKDAVTGSEIHSASIYDKESRVSALTNEYGYFSLKISQKDKIRDVTLFVNKEKYKDTIVFIRQSGRSVLSLNIYPDEKIITYVDSSAIRDSIFTVNRLALVHMILSEEERANTRNIKDTLHRKFQFSFLPYLGTNLKLSGNTVNDYSLNVLAGYSMGTRKVEIAGLVNIDRDSVKLAQVAGLINMTGGPVQGAQVAGLVNYNLKPIKGFQAAGLVNANLDSSKAVSIAGLLNVNLGPSQAFQAAGLANFTLKSSKKAQVAGLLNVSLEKMQGVQAAGLLNVCLDEIEGAQVSGLVNVARSVVGSQIGFLNIADTCTGVPIGFISFVRKGYHQFEISSNEVFPLNVALRTGVRRFYTILNAGMQFKTPERHTWYYGYGVGTAVQLSPSWLLDFDVTLDQPVRENRVDNFNPLTKINITAEKKLSKGITLAGGPSLNILYANTSDPDYEGFLKQLPPGSFSGSAISGDYQRSVWLGAKVALRFF